MYFKEKDDTNIDEEFQQKKTIDLQKYKPLIFIIGGLIILFVIIFIVFALTKKEEPTTYTLELLGGKEITLSLGNDYLEPGYTAFDNNLNDVSEEVSISSNLKINEVGTYQITYMIHNQEVTRTIKIVEPNNATYIYLKGEKNMYLKIGEQYTEPGYLAHDTIDGSITDKVTVTGSVDTKQKGLYKLVYSVLNSNGITTQVERNVIVIEK